MKQLLPTLFFLLLVALGCNSGREQANTSAPPPGPPMPVKADDLIKAYKANEIAADEKYRGKLLEVAGKVSDISDTLGSLQVDLGISTKDFEMVTVKCSFPDSERPKIAKLQKGNTATFLGRGDGMTAGLYVGLTDCSLK